MVEVICNFQISSTLHDRDSPFFWGGGDHNPREAIFVYLLTVATCRGKNKEAKQSHINLHYQ